jgi:hypothetical protein
MAAMECTLLRQHIHDVLALDRDEPLRVSVGAERFYSTRQYSSAKGVYCVQYRYDYCQLLHYSQ